MRHMKRQRMSWSPVQRAIQSMRRWRVALGITSSWLRGDDEARTLLIIYWSLSEESRDSSTRFKQSSTVSQKRATFRLRGIRTPPAAALLVTVLPTWPLSSSLSLCNPSVTTSTFHRSPPWSSNSMPKPSKSTAIAMGSCNGGPIFNPKTSLYVLAKKTSRSWNSRRITEWSSVDRTPRDPVRSRCWTFSVASTWCVKSNGIIVVFPANSSFEKIAWAASGSHYCCQPQHNPLAPHFSLT